MDRSRVVYLISKTYTQDAKGVQIPETTERKVYADVTSATQNEWFEGGRSGINPVYRVTTFSPDYKGESTVRVGDEYFSVYRTYQKKDDTIELYLRKRKGAEE